MYGKLIIVIMILLSTNLFAEKFDEDLTAVPVALKATENQGLVDAIIQKLIQIEGCLGYDGQFLSTVKEVLTNSQVGSYKIKDLSCPSDCKIAWIQEKMPYKLKVQLNGSKDRPSEFEIDIEKNTQWSVNVVGCLLVDAIINKFINFEDKLKDDKDFLSKNTRRLK